MTKTISATKTLITSSKMFKSNSNTRTQTMTMLFITFLAIILPVIAASVVPLQVPSALVGEGQVLGPEEMIYDAATGLVYTGTEDGWVKRVTVNESAADSLVEDWLYTGGRPLGLAIDANGELIVADADLGLLKVTKEKQIEVLTTESDGLPFKLTDGVDIAKDGTIYFTDASSKYSFADAIQDILEGNPNGRFLSYDPSTKKTTLLLSDLYFPNGVVVSPDQQSVIFCETPLMNCKTYYIKGPKKGSVEIFIDDLPGSPDNIHYIGDGQYVLGIAPPITSQLDLLLGYPFLRNKEAMARKYLRRQNIEKIDGGVLVIDLEGKLTNHYYDPDYLSITSAIKVDNFLYCGSLHYTFILRLDVSQDVNQYPALSST